MYSFKTTVWKGLKIFIIGGLTELGAVLAGLPAEQQVSAVLIATTVITALINLVKNYSE